MARLSRATRETILTISVLVAAILVILVFVVYPLNRSKVFFGRQDIDKFDPKVKTANDPALFVQDGLVVDTVRIEADGLTNLAAVAILPSGSAATSPRGQVILPLSEEFDRTKAASVAKLLADSGFSVWAFDQRAVGFSTGKYHSDGQLESQDLEGLVSYLELHSKLHHPLVVVGYGLAGDAALFASAEEKRIDAVLAVNPNLTTEHQVAELRQQHSLIWFPFWKNVLWWWYKIRSGYAANFRTLDDLKPLAIRSIIAASQGGSPELAKLKALTPPELLRITPVPGSDQELVNLIIGLTRP
jgi:pimeloyl-ACP methyl ester carboxylesterase